MFEKSTWIRLPRSVVVGHGVVEQTADVLDDIHLPGTPLVVTSPTPWDVAGDRIVAQLSEIGPDPEVIVVKKASFDAIERVLDRADELDPGYLVGVGGGKGRGTFGPSARSRGAAARGHHRERSDRGAQRVPGSEATERSEERRVGKEC